ncbi:MAG: hypothetical protein WC770_00635 [Phycisphaerae bacterium]|jgi:hypothetical protein
MKKLEAVILGVAFAPAPILFCLALIVSFCFFAGLLTDATGPYLALTALGVGIVINIIFLKKWVQKAYQLNNKAIIALYAFYSMIAFGVCMGIPLFNYILGIMAGVYIIRKMYYLKADETEYIRNIKKTAMFTAAVMLVLCCLMVLLGLAGKVNGKDFEVLFKSLFGLTFTINTAGFVSIIFFGACAMVLLQYWLTRLSAKITFKLSR